MSQRPIAIHGLEHLGATDRGLTMLRKIVRDGIHAVQRGEDPDGLFPPGTKNIPTFTQDTITRIAPRPTHEEDMQLLRETGRKVAHDGFTNHPTTRA